MTKLNQLLKLDQTVFTIDDLSVVWGQNKRSDTVQSIRNYVKSGKIYRLKRGLYSTQKTPDIFCVANKIIPPSYVTGLTVLIKNGLSFQASDTIHNAAKYHKKITVSNQIFLYQKLDERILFNSSGLEFTNGALFATTERAICDMFYWNEKVEIDFYNSINWDRLSNLAQLYNKKTVVSRVAILQKKHRGY